jgi:hypothetical protein
MNYLDLAKRLVVEAGISGNGPASVLNQSGEMKRVVGWVQSAYEDLQLVHEDWYFLRGSFSFVTTPDKFRYTPIEAGIPTPIMGESRFLNWDINSMAISNTGEANDQSLLNFISYQQYRDHYLQSVMTSSRPLVISVSPKLELLLGDKPNREYTITGEYYKKPQVLVNNVDVPELPSQYHMAIVYRALMLYARFEAAGEIYQDAEMNYKRFLNKIRNNQLPGFDMPDPLV